MFWESRQERAVGQELKLQPSVNKQLPSTQTLWSWPLASSMIAVYIFYGALGLLIKKEEVGAFWSMPASPDGTGVLMGGGLRM